MTESIQSVATTPVDPEARGPKAVQILEAAEALLLEVGYDGLSAKAVADRAGVNKALIFYYWGSTTVLFERVLERYYIRHKGMLFGALQGEGDLGTRLHRVVDALFASVEEDPLYPRLVQQLVSSKGPHLHLVQKHYRAIQAELEESLRGQGALTGPRSVRQFHLTFSAVTINYFTYGECFGFDVYADLEERRAHVHWMVDAWMAALEQAQAD